MAQPQQKREAEASQKCAQLFKTRMPAQAASTDVNQCEIVDYNIAYYDSLTTICPDEIMYPDTTSIPTNSKDI